MNPLENDLAHRRNESYPREKYTFEIDPGIVSDRTTNTHEVSIWCHSKLLLRISDRRDRLDALNEFECDREDF